MEAVIRELSSQLTNLYFDVNIHQRTSMAYLSSNNDNIVTLIKYVACITAVSDIKNSSSIYQVLKEVIINRNYW